MIEINTRRLLLLGSVVALLLIADGFGRLLPPSEGVDAAGPAAASSARERLKEAVPQIVLGFWSCLCVMLAAGLVCGLKLVECRLCGGAGRLSLEAQPPGEPGFRVDTDCVHCEGHGRQGLLDRWVG